MRRQVKRRQRKASSTGVGMPRPSPASLQARQAWGDGVGSAGETQACARIDDRNGVPRSHGRRLMELDGRGAMIMGIRVHDALRGVCGCRWDGLRRLRQVLQGGRVGRITREGRSIGRRWRRDVVQLITATDESSYAPDGDREHHTHVVLGQQGGAEFQVVVEVKGSSGLESGAKGHDRGGLGQLLHTSDPPKRLEGVVVGGEPGAATSATGVVRMRMWMPMRWIRGRG